MNDNGTKTALRHFVICLCCILFSITLAAQNRKVTISVRNEPISNVLKQLEQATGFTFFYNNDSFDKSKEVTLDVKDEDILSIIELIFTDTDISASVIDKSIILSAIPKQKKSTVEKIPEDGRIVISGRIIDMNEEPVIGAAIVSASDKSTACVTDLDGAFSLKVKKGDFIEVSALGFIPETIRASASSSKIVIAMKEDIQLLDEVVVVGYGVQKRSDITGAIASVDTEQAKNVPTTSIAEMLRGTAPGIQVSLGSAAPGGSSSILIRGRHSLSGDNSPLYIVDGVPMTSIDDINANEIASIEILKDASSQSIYGARAANGVILVTTKRGSAGKTKVSYNGYVAVQTVNKNFDFYNGDEWAAYRHEAFYNAYGYYDQEECFRGYMKEILESGKFVDWESVMIRPAIQHNHDIMVQAGTDKAKIAASIGYYDQKGMVTTSGFKKVSGRINMDYRLCKSINIGANISYSHSWKESADGSFNQFVTMPPLAKIHDENGNLLQDVTAAGESHINPLWNIGNAKNHSTQSRLLVNAFVDWKIYKGISYRLNASMNQRHVDSGSYLGLEHTTGRNTQGKATSNKSTAGDYLLENILNFNYDFQGGHHFDATVMQSINVITWKKIGINATGFANDDLGYNAIGNAVEYGHPSYELSRRNIVSFMGRARYNYSDRYLFTVAVRVDGSSVFGNNNKYGIFPSAAFAWRVNKEKFMKGSENWLNNLKLRLSWGQVGNQGISPYTTLGNANPYYYLFGDMIAGGYLPSNVLHNPDLKWETSTTSNIGIDFGFLKDRINGSVELYNTNTTDLLVSKSLNQVLGYTSQIVNLGKVRNRGIEVVLNTVPVSTKNFIWNLDLSFARNVNEIVRISDELDENGKPIDDVNNKWFIGQPTNVYYDYKFDGIWQNDDDIANSCMPNAKPGYIKISDTDKNGSIDEKDRIVMPKDPKWIGNIRTGFSFYGFDITADFNISFGGTFYNSYLSTFDTGGDMTGKRNGIRRNYWTKYNPSNEAPAPNMAQAPAYITALGYQDATFVRLRNVTLGYNFPQEIIRKILLSNLRLYLTCNNVWYHTKVLGYGPEQSPGAYPEPRTFLFGIKVSF